MNYGNYMNNEIKNCQFLDFSICINFSKKRKCFSMFGVFCIINLYCEYRVRILCIFLYTGTYFKDIVQPFRPQK